MQLLHGAGADAAEARRAQGGHLEHRRRRAPHGHRLETSAFFQKRYQETKRYKKIRKRQKETHRRPSVAAVEDSFAVRVDDGGDSEHGRPADRAVPAERALAALSDAVFHARRGLETDGEAASEASIHSRTTRRKCEVRALGHRAAPRLGREKDRVSFSKRHTTTECAGRSSRDYSARVSDEREREAARARAVSLSLFLNAIAYRVSPLKSPEATLLETRALRSGCAFSSFLSRTTKRQPDGRSTRRARL